MIHNAKLAQLLNKTIVVQENNAGTRKNAKK